ncbi:sorbosone dehydrogenase family protein [Nocardioides sp.]|uniref:PQQ-dependent sugar dehydrogenase n=1 Tax=Nocardioides sp. TaxID=35761 RepID=UPI00356358C7
MRLLPHLAATTLALTLLSAPAQAASPAPGLQEPSTAQSTGNVAARAIPALKVRTVASGLDLVWDVKTVGQGRLLFTQRNRATLSRLAGGKVRTVKGFPSHRIWVSGETGLLGLEVDPNFAKNKRIYTCQGWVKKGGDHDIRVIAWKLNASAQRVRSRRTLVKGLPTTSGRHGGCRVLVDSRGSLLIGTGDAADGTNPRNLDSLGGKTLRVNRFNGAPWATNPFAKSSKPRRLVFTYGHRNVQGVAERSDGTLWSMEHGPDRNDEVNRLKRGGDYGWNPVPGYNESVPMTDQGLPGQQTNARWSSGVPTVATSGGTFVAGKKWGAYRGTLAVACLKASQVMFLKFDTKGRFVRLWTPAALKQYGRLRTVSRLPNGTLLVATSNGGNQDVILKVKPT